MACQKSPRNRGIFHRDPSDPSVTPDAQVPPVAAGTAGTQDPADVVRGLTWELCRISPRYTWIYLFSEEKNMEKP